MRRDGTMLLGIGTTRCVRGACSATCRRKLARGQSHGTCFYGRTDEHENGPVLRFEER